MKKILVVAAHPDDEILGCGGTVARFVREGVEAYALILGEGVTGRDEKRNLKRREKEISQLRGQAESANGVIGVKKIYIADFKDNRFDSHDLLDIVKFIDKIKKMIQPDVIFTHYENDLNIDHRITYQAVLIATRPMMDETVKEIYSFEVPSSTEWNYPLRFSPNIYFDITGTLELKLKAVKEYVSEIRTFPHPRSIEAVELAAKYHGVRVGRKYVEAFQCVRAVK